MSTKTGQEAEAKAAEWLEAQDYKLLDKNWRTKWCEIDLIAQKDGRFFFIEVKYRRRSDSGGGLSYITPRKLKQMSFAADMWMSQQEETGDYELSAMEMSGQPPEVDEFISELT